MKITEETIPLIEKALNIELYPWQKEWLINDTPFPDICPCLLYYFKESIVKSCTYSFDGKRCHARNRMTGKTTVHCIDLALSDGIDQTVSDFYRRRKIFIKGTSPIDTRKMEYYSDYGDGSRRYANGFYRRMFLDIWHALKEVGLPVRELRF